MSKVQPSFSGSAAEAPAPKTRKPRAPKDPNKVTFKKAPAELQPCLGHGRRFRVEGSCSVVLDGLLAVHPTPATMPTDGSETVSGVRGWYSVTHVPTGLALRAGIEGAKLVRAYVAELVRVTREAGAEWASFADSTKRPSFSRFDAEAMQHAEAVSRGESGGESAADEAGSD